MKTRLLALAVAASLPALAGNDSRPKKIEPKEDKEVVHAICPQVDKPAPAAQSALIVVRDPQTGKLRPPTAAEAEALSGGAGREALAPPAGSGVIQKPDGSKMVRLNGQFFSTVVVRKKDGKTEQDCFSDEAAAKRYADGADQPARVEK